MQQQSTNHYTQKRHLLGYYQATTPQLHIFSEHIKNRLDFEKRGAVGCWHLAAIRKMKVLLKKQEGIPCHGVVDPWSLEAIRSLSPMSGN
jgi:hypothetical protein